MTILVAFCSYAFVLATPTTVAAAIESIAHNVGIETVKSNLSPENKMQAITELKDEGYNTCMIGDGVNDALALNTSDAEIAIGGTGSDIAVESADAVLVTDSIKNIPYLFLLSKKAMHKVKQNIVISLLINFGVCICAALGLLNPITGALIHNAGSVL